MSSSRSSLSSACRSRSGPPTPPRPRRRGRADIRPALATAFGLVADAAREARDIWWVIGSAAMALHGAEVEVGDVDLLMSRTDAARLLERHGRVPAAGSAHDKFRSEVFGQLECGGYTVEVMGGFHVRDGAEWREVRPRSRVAFRVGDAELFAPSVEELIEMCRLFGRPKDAERERVLRALYPPLEGEGDHA